MDTLHGRAGPRARKRGRGGFGRQASTPNQAPSSSESAYSDDSAKSGVWETPSVADSGQLLPDAPRAALDTPSLLASGGDCWQDGSFTVHLRLDGRADSGARRRWLETILFGGGPSSLDAGTSGPWDAGADGEEYGVGVREPRPVPISPSSGASATASVETPSDLILV